MALHATPSVEGATVTAAKVETLRGGTQVIGDEPVVLDSSNNAVFFVEPDVNAVDELSFNIQFTASKSGYNSVSKKYQCNMTLVNSSPK